MATVALGVAGASYGPWGQALGAAIGSYIDNQFLIPALFPQDPLQGPRAGDVQVQAASEGAPSVRALGAECRVAGTVIWVSKLRETASTDQVGGKGGPGVKQTTYSYAVDVAVKFCEGPPDGNGIVEFSEILANTKTLYKEHPDKSASATTLTADATTYSRTYTGSDGSTFTVVDHYELVITSPNGGPDLSVFVAGADADVSGFTQAVDNGTFRCIASEIDEGTGISTVTFKSEDVVFVDDANGSANTITIEQTLPKFNANQIESVSVYLGTEAQTANSTIQAQEEDVPAFRGDAYVVFKNLQLAEFGNQLPNFNAIVWATGADYYDGADPETVGGALSKLLAWAKRDNSRLQGLSALTFDTSAVDDIPLRGYYTFGAQTLREAVQPLLLAYDVSAQEADGVVTFFRRRDAPVVEVDPDDLACHPIGGDAPRPFRVSDGRGQVLPKEVVVKYRDPEVRYQAGAQAARRIGAAAPRSMSVDLPLVMTAVEAKDIAERVLWTQWANRRRVEVRLPPSYFEIQEGDILHWVDPDTGKDWRMLVLTIDRGANHLVQIDGVEEVSALMDWTSKADESGAPSGGDGPYHPPELRFWPVDVGCLRDEDATTPGFYHASSVYDSALAWAGASLWRSVDDVTYESLGAVSSEATQGHTTSTLGDVPDPSTWDRGNVLAVRLYGGKQLSSATEEEVLAGANRILVGNEVIGFATATLTAANEYDLTDLLRGLAGTELVTGDHVAKEHVLLLDAGGVYFQAVPLSEIGATRYYKSVPNAGSEPDYAAVGLEEVAMSVWPLSVADLEGVRETSNDWTLIWRRRSRLAVDPFRTDELPLLEDEELYDIEVLNVGTGTLVAIYESTTPDFTYTSSQQTTDFGSAQSTIRVKVYQRGTLVHRGRGVDSTFSG